MDETRSIIRNLGPQNLKRTGLTEAIINILENIEDAFGVVFEKEIENIDDLFSEEAELNIYRIVQESLNNVLKHSESPRALVKIKKMRAKIEIQITDFGVGFQVADFETTDPGGNAGIGLRSLYERSELLGGTVLIDSTINEGTTVSIRIPVENEPRN